MNYEKAYKGALERARKMKSPYCQAAVETIFPELCESKDERIRKEIISFITNTRNWFPKEETKASWIAWLEKQGNYDYKRVNLSNFDARIREFSDMLEDKPKPYWDGWYEAMDYVLKNGNPFEKQGEKSEYNPYKATVESIAEMCKSYSTSTDLHDFYDNVRVKCKDAMEYEKTWNEKQGEQKPADESEPKFKVGDWVVYEHNGNVYQIHSIDNSDSNYIRYICKPHSNDDTPCIHEYMIRPWTIQDAKDGDVLVCIGKYGQEIGIIKEYVGKYGGCDKCFETYCFVDWGGVFRTGEYIGSKEIHPATKEQRDILFQKMKEEGYEWDAEKKELKKIEQKPAWSEEDEKFFKTALWHISYSVSNGKTTDDHCDTTDWLKNVKKRLKSIKPNHWKPSEEQITSLGRFIEGVYGCVDFMNIKSLYNDLKNL
jgi:hypothetical protein